MDRSAPESFLNFSPEQMTEIEKMIQERTGALETEIADRKKAERKLIRTLDKLEKKRIAILNLMEDLREEIEERKKIEKKLEAERNLLLTVIDNIPSPINLKDKDGKYIINNRKHLQLIGAESREEVTGKTAFEYFSEENALKFQQSEKEVLRTGKPVINMEECLVYRKTNEIKWHLTSKIPVPDENGNLTRVLTISHDITDQKLLENKLRASENYYKTLIDISPDAISLFDTEGNLIYASKNAYRLFEAPHDLDLTETTILDWIDPSFHDNVASTIARIIAGEEKLVINEYLLRKYTGEPFWCEVSSGPLTDDKGNIISFIIICRDITERKKNHQELIRAKEKAEESDRLKTAFLNNISHEIRTPVNVISGYTMLLKQADNEPEVINTYLDTIIKSCNQLIEMIHDVIELSNIEAGTLKTETKETNINKLLTALFEKFLKKAADKNLELHYEKPLPYEKALLITDEQKLAKIMTCLLSNALKFTSEGNVNFGYRVKNGTIDFYVTDTGIGIDPEFHEKIFEKFFQVEYSLSRKYEGLGIGLTIAKAYTEIMNGKIKVDSAPGKGSAFTVSLPYHETPEYNVTRELEKYAPPKISPSIRNILVVEDDENSKKFIEIILKKQGLNVTSVQNGKEAVELIKKGINFDAVLMDLRMPVMDGYEATRIIKKLKPEIPVIAQTAFSQPEDKQKAQEAGCNAFITKPFRSSDLIDIINKAADI